MKIIDAFCIDGRTGFFFDDQLAIKEGAPLDGAFYEGDPKTSGFSNIRQAGESILITLVLEDGQTVYGDCAAVQYSGAGGRDPLFLAAAFIPLLERTVFPLFIGQEADNFKRLAALLEEIEVEGSKLHTALSYGLSQALLAAVAKAKKLQICEIVAQENKLTLTSKPLAIFTQSGDQRYDNVDKMILKEAPILPHGLINEVKTKLGEDGGLLLEYIVWMKERVQKQRHSKTYAPVFHLDVYGTIGQIFGAKNYEAMVAYFKKLEKAAAPFRLRIEGPVDAGSREGQMLALKELTRLIDEQNISLEIVADEWCNTLEDIKYFADNRAGHMIQIKTPDLGSVQNTIEAVLYCKQRGVLAYQGGTCNETDGSAKVCVQIAMATKPDQILAKPGMGVDEGYMIVYNEMQRIRSMLEWKGAKHE